MNNELNKKLAEWVGFKHSTYRDEEHPSKEYHCWILPRATTAYITDHEMPNFTESLDACFKWLVPKLTGLQQIILQPDEGKRWYLGMTVDDELYENIGFYPALALCLAMEKLIDGEK